MLALNLSEATLLPYDESEINPAGEGVRMLRAEHAPAALPSTTSARSTLRQALSITPAISWRPSNGHASGPIEEIWVAHLAQ